MEILDEYQTGMTILLAPLGLTAASAISLNESWLLLFVGIFAIFIFTQIGKCIATKRLLLSKNRFDL